MSSVLRWLQRSLPQKTFCGESFCNSSQNFPRRTEGKKGKLSKYRGVGGGGLTLVVIQASQDVRDKEQRLHSFLGAIAPLHAPSRVAASQWRGCQLFFWNIAPIVQRSDHQQDETFSAACCKGACQILVETAEWPTLCLLSLQSDRHFAYWTTVLKHYLSDPTEIPPYRETGVAIPLSHCVSCGITDYCCCTPTSFRKYGLSQSKDRPHKEASQKKLASEAYRATGEFAQNSIANCAIVGH